MEAKRTLLLLLALAVAGLAPSSGASAAADANTIWQLGLRDGASDEFVPLNIGVFVDNRTIGRTRRFDVESQTFSCEIRERGLTKKPQLPSGLLSKLNVRFDRHAVTRILLTWSEEAAGSRAFEVHTVRYRDKLGSMTKLAEEVDLADDIRVSLPGKKVTYMQIPLTHADLCEAGDLNWKAHLTVEPGRNTIAMEMNNHRVNTCILFDYLRLARTSETTPLQPALEVTTTRLANVFFTDEDVALDVTAYNLSPKGRNLLEWRIRDYFGSFLAQSRMELRADGYGCSCTRLPFASEAHGYFEIEVSLLDHRGCRAELSSAADVVVAPFARTVRPTAPNSSDACSPFGIHTFTECYTAPQDTRYIEQSAWLARAMGARWSRILAFQWRMIEPAKGKYAWDCYDAWVGACEKNNLNILGCLMGTPVWARDDPPSQSTAHGQGLFEFPDPDEWYGFVHKTVTRYKDTITHWEVWNEPHPYGVDYWSTDGANYRRLMEATYRAAKQADPDSLILIGASGTGSRSVFAAWHEAILGQGGGCYFDIFNVHYLPLSWRKQQGLPKLLQQYGLSQKPVWDTEVHTGASSTRRRLEAEDIVKVFLRDMSYGVERSFYFLLRQALLSPERTTQPHGGMMVTPGFVAYRTMTHQLDRAKYYGGIELIAGVEGHVLFREEEPITVLWSNLRAPQRVRLPVGKKRVKVAGIMDNEEETLPTRGAIPLTLSSTPLFVIGADRDIVLLQTSLRLDPKESVLVRGESQGLQLRLTSVFDHPTEASVKVSVPDGWVAEPAAKMIALAENATLVLPLTVTTPPDVEQGEQTVHVEADLVRESVSFSTFASITSVLDPPGTYLVANGSFELIQEDGAPVGWDLYADRAGTGRITIAEGKGLSGARAVAIRTQDERSNVYFSTRDAIAVLPGKNYAISLWAKGDNVRGGTHIVQYREDGTKLSTEMNAFHFDAGTDWAKSESVYHVPRDVTSVKIYFIDWHQEGSMYVDDVGFRLLR